MTPSKLGARWRRAALAAIAAALVVVAIVGVPAPASAHAVLVASDPADGAELDTSPAAVVLTFDEPVQLIDGTAQVLSGTGARVDAGGAHTRDATLTIPLKPDLPRGGYTVTWRVLSADAHLVSGSIAFGVRQSAHPVGSSTTPTAATGPLDLVSQAAVGVGYLGGILLFGVLAAATFLWPATLARRRTRVMLGAGWWALLAATVVQLLLEGPRARESGWAGTLTLDGLGQTLGSSVGAALAARLALLALVPVARALPTRARAGAALALGAGVLVTIALTGHAAAGDDVPLAAAAAWLHLAAMAVWIGGLLLLFGAVLPGIRTDDDLAAARLPRWSVVAFTAVVVLVVTGEYQAWRQVQPPAALWSTAYGLTLLVKLGLVVLVLAAAAAGQRMIARRRTSRGAGSGSAVAPGADPARRLRRTVAVELAIVSLVVAATTVLTALPPASATYGPPVTVTAPLPADLALTADFASTRHGSLALTVTVAGPDGPVAADDVTATLSSDEHGIAAIAVPLERDGDTWRSTGASVPLAGDWTVSFRVAIGGAATVASVDTTFW